MIDPTLWHTAVDKGQEARHPKLRQDVKATVGMILAGTVVPELAAPRQWAKDLPREQQEHLLDLALADVDILEEMIDGVWQDIQDGDAEAKFYLPDTVSWLCYNREALEGVWLLLREISLDRSLPLEGATAPLDERGRALRKRLDQLGIHVSSPRLEDTYLSDPEAWWAYLQPVRDRGEI
jgi:hypothetical protein